MNPNKRNENELYSYQLILFSAGSEFSSLWLPKICEGVYRFSETDYSFFKVKAEDGKWIAECSAPAFFPDVSVRYASAIELKEDELITISCDDEAYYLFVEKMQSAELEFHKFSLPADVEIDIGRDKSSDIVLSNRYASLEEFSLRRHDGTWSIRNHGSRYGFFVNGKPGDDQDLKLGDVIYDMGLRIIIGTTFISVNSDAQNIRINSLSLKNSIEDITGFGKYSGQRIEENEERYFNRAPRKRIILEERTIDVEAPPMSVSRAESPIMLRMGSSMVSSGMAAINGNYTMLLTSLLFPLLNSKYTDKQKADYEKLRVSKYAEYLELKRREIHDECEYEKGVLNVKYPILTDVLSSAANKNNIWQRRPIDDDFLYVRLGTGDVPMKANVKYPEKRFELDSDELEDNMYRLAETNYTVEDAPIGFSLKENTVLGINGDRREVLSYIKGLILQIASLHSYDEVKMIFLMPPEELEKLEFIKYLPHVWNDSRTTRFIATDEAEAYRIGEYLENQIAEGLDGKSELNKILKNRPYYLIFSFNKKLFDGHEVFKSILQMDENHGMTNLIVYDDLPKETQKILNVSSNSALTLTSLEANGGNEISFAKDPYDGTAVQTAARTLSNTFLKTASLEQELPKAVPFLEMYNVGKVEQLNVSKRWKENNPIKSLAAPVGIAADGSLFMLDLHQKRQGPHGLVAGMTGSGKSEFLISYILSMAINYHPDEVAFLLIDYKGGGLAGAFENKETGVRLPHLVGTITNLDGASIERSLASINSELVRRQKIFKDVAAANNEGTMDIYSYQKLYRQGKVDEPLPHLFIISDEFAELKQQQPEFMTELISAARIGRSLGVHLILATQRPTGVVDDQIRSNTKFRVCLKVQDRSDSMDMLSRPEAAELTDTGRFYLQVGYNEFFAIGQSAYSGVDYEPMETVPIKKDNSLDFLDITGQVIHRAVPQITKSSSGVKQIVAVVEHLAELAKAQGINSRQICTPELPTIINHEELQKKKEDPKASMKVLLGLVDDPKNQIQYPYEYDFDRSGNLLIVGEQGSGKSAMLQNMVYSLAKQLGPDEFNFYALDYSGRMLRLFKDLPHCGAVMLEEDAASLTDFFKLINSIVTARKKKFTELSVDNFTDARKKEPMPLILVLIDNFLGFTSTKQGENIGYELSKYLRDSAIYGVKYVISAGHLNDVSSRIRQVIPERICLHISDKFDYTDALQNAEVTYLPRNISGRGLVALGGEAYEFHSSLLFPEEESEGRTDKIREAINDIIQNTKSLNTAIHMPVLDQNAEFEDFCGQFRPGRIPLGFSVSSKKPVAIPLKQMDSLCVYFGNPFGKEKILGNIIYAAKKEGMKLWCMTSSEDSILNKEEFGIDPEDVFFPDEDGLVSFRTRLRSEYKERSAQIEAYCTENSITGEDSVKCEKAYPYVMKTTKPILILIENHAEFASRVDMISSMILLGMLNSAKSRNIYIISCFAPEDYIELEGNSLYFGFNENGNALLLGGNFDKQVKFVLPENESFGQIWGFNTGIMYYREDYHVVLIPCGEVVEENINEDEKDIFS